MFCSSCGYSVQDGAKFCSCCGNSLQDQSGTGNTKRFAINELRVAYAGKGDLAIPEGHEDSQHIELDVDSELAKNAGEPFDPSNPPSVGDLVPADCVWSLLEHPGSFPDNPGSYSSIDKKFVAMGQLPGRTFSEIASQVGPPMADVNHGPYRNCVWGKTGMFSIWQIGLAFDTYGVCINIYSQTDM